MRRLKRRRLHEEISITGEKALEYIDDLIGYLEGYLKALEKFDGEIKDYFKGELQDVSQEVKDGLEEIYELGLDAETFAENYDRIRKIAINLHKLVDESSADIRYKLLNFFDPEDGEGAYYLQRIERALRWLCDLYGVEAPEGYFEA